MFSPSLFSPGSPRTRQWAGVCDLREPARVLPQYHIRHHRQLRHLRPRGGPVGTGPASSAKAEQPHDSTCAPVATSCTALSPGGSGPPPPL